MAYSFTALHFDSTVATCEHRFWPVWFLLYVVENG